MQTNTWMPAPTTPRRPGWLEVIGWYFAGGFATGTAWTFVALVGKLASRTVASFVGQALFIAGIVALVRYGGALHRRSRTALVLGAVTPFLIAVALIAYLLWAFAHSDWQF